MSEAALYAMQACAQRVESVRECTLSLSPSLPLTFRGVPADPVTPILHLYNSHA